MIIEAEQDIFFEAYTVDGLSRSGPIEADGDISMMKDEIRFVIKQADGTTIYDTEIRYEPEAVQIYRPCVVKIHEDALTLYLKNWSGEKTLKWHNIKTPEGILSKSFEDSEIYADGLETGEYSFFVWQNDTVLCSFNVEFVNETRSEVLERILLYVQNPDNHQQEAIAAVDYKKDFVDSTFTELFHEQFMLLPSDADDDEIIALWRLVEASMLVENAALELANSRMIHYRRAPVPTVAIDGTASKISFIDEKDKNPPAVFHYVSGVLSVDIAPDVLWRVEAFNSDGDMCGILRLVSQNEQVRRIIWEEQRSGQVSLDDATGVDSNIPVEWSVFSDEEVSLALIRRSKNPAMPLFSPPLLVEEAGKQWAVEFMDYEFMEATGIDLYLVIQEPELILSHGYERRIPITEETVTINRNMRRIFDTEDYFLWIQDGSGRILSDLMLTRCGDMERYKDFMETLRRQEVAEKGRALIDYLGGVPEFQSRVSSIMNSLLFNEYVYPVSMHKAVMRILLSEQMFTGKFARQFILVLGDFLNDWNLDREFFSCIYWDSQLDEITVPPRGDGYLLCLMKMDIGEVETMEYIDSLTTAVEIQCRDNDLYAVWAIDRTTMKHSGCAMVCTLDRARDVLGWNMEIRGLYDGNII